MKTGFKIAHILKVKKSDRIARNVDIKSIKIGTIVSFTICFLRNAGIKSVK